MSNRSGSFAVDGIQVLSITCDGTESLMNIRVRTAPILLGLMRTPCAVRLIPSNNPNGGVDMFLEVTLRRGLRDETSLHYEGNSLGQGYQVYVNGEPRLHYFAGSRIVERPGFLKSTQ